jgi:phosphohistidine phosphatase
MKLFFLRHGLADRSAWNGSDFERPLTPYGKERMGREADSIAKLNLGLQAIISSPLVRALQTAEIVAERLDMLDLLIVDERVSPGFGVNDVAAIIEDHPEVECLMFVGHEPDFSQTIERLIGGGSVECKKGSLARVDLVDAGPLSGVLIWLVPPKILA